MYKVLVVNISDNDNIQEFENFLNDNWTIKHATPSLGNHGFGNHYGVVVYVLYKSEES